MTARAYPGRSANLFFPRARSSAGRAPHWQCGGQGFEPPRVHQNLHRGPTRPDNRLFQKQAERRQRHQTRDLPGVQVHQDLPEQRLYEVPPLGIGGKPPEPRQVLQTICDSLYRVQLDGTQDRELGIDLGEALLVLDISKCAVGVGASQPLARRAPLSLIGMT